MESANVPRVARSIRQVSGVESRQAMGTLIAVYSTMNAYKLQPIHERRRDAKSTAAKRRTTSTSCHMYAGSAHGDKGTVRPHRTNTLASTKTASRQVGFMGAPD